MITYQDFMKVPENRRIDYVRSIISQHKSSKEYKFAEVAEEYYKHRNVTIRRLVRLLYTVTGKQIPDTFSTDWRLRTDWFNFFTVQLNQYLLSNGVSWQNEDTKDKLGVKFDRNLKKLGRYALTHKVSFGFWNLDHLEPYSFLEFAPIYDEENGALTAGVRFWQIDSSKPLRAQLFEPDGYTDLMWTADGKGKETGEILHPKRPYIQVMRTSEADGTEIYDGYNYPTFPIVPFYGIEKQSELEGRQELIDCCDLILSGFANTIEDASYIYWAIQGANGMKDIDLAKFIQHMKTIHAALVKGDGATATPNAIEAPYAGRKALLDELREQLFYNFKGFDSRNITGGAVIPQIESAYEMLDQKANDYEDCVFDFLDGIMKVAGIDDTPTLTRSKITSRQEEINTVLMCRDVLTEDYTTKKILTILGDGDLADDIIQERDAESLESIMGTSYEDSSEDAISMLEELLEDIG